MRAADPQPGGQARPPHGALPRHGPGLGPRGGPGPGHTGTGGKAASLLLTCQNLEKELASRRQDWVREHGLVQVGDLVYGPTQAVSYDLDAQAVVQFLLEAGLDRDTVWPILNITKTGLERGLKKLKRKDLLEHILTTAPSKMIEKVGFRKVNP
jgi:hypothetical protein